jgi:hypothetical protein
MRSRPQKSRLIVIGVLVTVGAVLLSTPLVHASGSTQTIAQAFHIANGNEIATGAIVSTKSTDSQTVELATPDSATRLIGVIDTYPLLAISAHEEGAHVVISGTTSVLVSDINGPIKTGDKITASPVAGVGMHATDNSQIVGSALADFSLANAKVRTITDTHGAKHTIHVGSVPLQVGVAYYQAPSSSYLPPFVQRVADLIAGRNVSITRILTSSILLLVSFIGVTVLVYVATRSAMISLGRNPLAAHNIRQSLYQAIGVAAVVAVVTILASYLILVV